MEGRRRGGGIMRDAESCILCLFGGEVFVLFVFSPFSLRNVGRDFGRGSLEFVLL